MKIKPESCMVTKILWMGPGKYVEYRDRESLEFAWIMYDKVPNNKVAEIDATTIEAIPKSFAEIETITFEKGRIMDNKGEIIQEIQSSCEAFGWGFNPDEDACIGCAEEFSDECQVCMEKTEELVARLENLGWKYVGDDMWESQDPDDDELFTIEEAKVLIEAEKETEDEIDVTAAKVAMKEYEEMTKEDVEDMNKFMEEAGFTKVKIDNPFGDGTKCALLYNHIIFNPLNISQTELIKTVAIEMDGDTKKNKAYIYSILAKWRKEIKKTGKKLVLEDGVLNIKEIKWVK